MTVDNRYESNIAGHLLVFIIPFTADDQSTQIGKPVVKEVIKMRTSKHIESEVTHLKFMVTKQSISNSSGAKIISRFDLWFFWQTCPNQLNYHKIRNWRVVWLLHYHQRWNVLWKFQRSRHNCQKELNHNHQYYFVTLNVLIW